MNYSPKKYKKLPSESIIKLLDTFDIEMENCIISGVLNHYIELRKYEVYVSLDNGEDIIDIFYKIFSDEKEAKKYYTDCFEKMKKRPNLQEILKNVE